jgi:hypothetical protein
MGLRLYHQQRCPPVLTTHSVSTWSFTDHRVVSSSTVQAPTGAATAGSGVVSASAGRIRPSIDLSGCASLPVAAAAVKRVRIAQCLVRSSCARLCR